ncbi:MAG: histidine kinase [Rhodospirillales bacterium]|jgi:two-component sensor histidine kinase|nr:histidine kinase [Rhodospirillales bacterium]
MATERSPRPEWDEKHLRAAVAAAGVALWAWNVDSGEFIMDGQGLDLWGVPDGTPVTFEELSSKIHPADVDRVRAAFTATRAIVGAYEIDFRIMVGDEVRWLSARGQGNDADIAHQRMFGIFIDVTGRKQAEESHELLAGEMSHRVKNLLQVAAGLAQFTSRTATTTQDMTRDLVNRLTALGRAHDLVRPLPGREGTAALLGDVLAVLLQRYEDTGAFNGRVRVSVPRMGIGEAGATALALVVHELATNSIKHGALSVANGTLDVSCDTHVDEGPGDDGHADEMVIVWTERGGPPVVAPTAALAGFGSVLIERSMSRQLGGSIDFNWSAEGAIVTMRISKNRLAK